MLRAGVGERADRFGADVFGGDARCEITRQSVDRHRQKMLQRRQRARIRRSIEEHAENARHRHAAGPRRLDEPRDVHGVVVADDLRQKELGVKVSVGDRLFNYEYTLTIH